MRAICRDCEEGKHGACIGEAFVELPGDELVRVDCWCAGAQHLPALEPADAADKWVVINLVGGYVCSVCEMPVESEPCKEHQPVAYAAAVGDTVLEELPSARRASDVPLWEVDHG